MPAKNPAKTAKNNSEEVNDFMHKLNHPLKAEIQAVREIIKNADARICERVKWNAPSFFYKADMVTFNPRATNHVHLVFHHPEIVNIKSELLEGEYKDRRMTYFRNMEEVTEKKEALKNIIQKLVQQLNEQKQYFQK